MGHHCFMRMTKRILKYVALFLMATFFLAVFWFFLGGAWCNDWRAAKLEREYARMELPEGAKRVETASFVGNTSGTGNHTEIWVGMLVYSELPVEELEAFYAGHMVEAVPEDLTVSYPYQKDFIEFQALQGKDCGKGYFVVGNYYDAVTQVDLRGH